MAIPYMDMIKASPEELQAIVHACFAELDADPALFWEDDQLNVMAHVRAHSPKLWLAYVTEWIQFFSKDDKARFFGMLDARAPEGIDAPECFEYEVLDDIEPEDVSWLWWPYFAKGTMAMLDGDPGVGKSLFSIRLAAAITMGQPLPDQQGHPTLDVEQSNVLILSAEDSKRFTIRPRFDKAGGDPKRIFLAGMLSQGGDDKRGFTLADTPMLRELIGKVEPQLVVIDPIQAYFGKVDMHRANETHPLLAALNKVAEDTGCCIVCVRHPAKPGAGTGKVLLRGLGSVDIIGTARTGVFVEQHPTDRNKALLMQSKSNIGPHGRTQIFSKENGVFEWAGVTRADAETLCGMNRGPDPLAMLECLFDMEKMLEGGAPWLSEDVSERLDEMGHSAKSIKNARKKLGVRATNNAGVWHVQLPSLEIIGATGSTGSTGSTGPYGGVNKTSTTRLFGYTGDTKPTGTSESFQGFRPHDPIGPVDPRGTTGPSKPSSCGGEKENVNTEPTGSTGSTGSSGDSKQNELLPPRNPSPWEDYVDPNF